MIKITVWPDDTWAFADDVYAGHYDWKSDDYAVYEIDESLDDDQIEELIQKGIL